MRFFHLYLKDGVVYLPTVARTVAGFYMDIEPVKVVQSGDRNALERAITDTLGSENLVVPTPTRATFPKAVVLKYANVKSWAAFEKKALVWSIDESGGVFRIKPGRRRADRGWEEDPERIESFPPGTAFETIAHRLASLVAIAMADDRALR